MISPRWKKLWRDLRAARGRMLMMVIALAVSILGVGTVLSAYTILSREISRNYLGTNPASAFLELDRVDDSVVQAVRQRPGILDAEATSWVLARVEVKPGQWMPLLLFVVADFDALRIDTFRPQAGAWPPPAQTMLLEREALRLIGAGIGDTFTVQAPDGPPQPVAISGAVHDPGLAPAWQEQTLYGYITPATLAWLGQGDTLHILKVTVKDLPQGAGAVDSTVSELAAWLTRQGRAVGEIRIPPPGLHPHQNQLNAILALLLIFSIMALVLSAILAATMIGGLLAQQIRQIGMMKAIGARSSQVTGLYVTMIALLGLVAVALGIPAGIAIGRSLAGAVAQLLNFTLFSLEIPAWVYAILLLMGVLAPLLVAQIPIWRASRTTVREILNDHGTNRDTFGSRGLDARLGRIRGLDNTLLLALRNAFRRRGRLLLTLGLLAAAGAMFMTGINFKSGWEGFLAEGAANRRYDLEIRLTSPQSEQAVVAAVAAVPGIEQVEAWNLAPAAVDRPDGLDIVRTYPDGGHGSFLLRSAPPGSTLIESPVLSGRWLQDGDAGGVALNQMAAAFFPGVRPGDAIRLSVAGRATSYRVVGIVRQIMTPAAAYVTPDTFAAAAGFPPQSVNGIRIVMAAHDAATVAAVTDRIGRALAAQRIGVKLFIPKTALEGASNAHVYVFIYSLIFMAVVMAVVGAIGLMSNMGASVVERTREFGVMRAIGARSATILRNIIAEGLFIGLMSWGVAMALSILPTLAVDNLIGNMFSRVPLPLVASPLGFGVWLLVIVLGSLAASVSPAWQASRLTVRETLAYI